MSLQSDANTCIQTYIAIATSIPEEDTNMEEPEITFVKEQDLDDQPQNYYFEFPIDPSRLVQDRDYMDSDSDNDSDDDDDEIMAISNDEEPLLRSIAPVSPSVVVKSTIPRMSTTKCDNRVAKKLHRKYNNQSDKKQRCLELYAYGYSYEKIAEILEIPESTVKLHHHRYSSRNGNAAPVKKKGPGFNKITTDGSAFLVRTILKQNTLTLDQIRCAYLSKYQALLSPSTIYRHLVNKCGVTIKRAHPYPER